MSSFAITALVLLTLDARQGEWVSLETLVARLVAPRQRIVEACNALVERNQVQHASKGAELFWGVGVEGRQP